MLNDRMCDTAATATILRSMIMYAATYCAPLCLHSDCQDVLIYMYNVCVLYLMLFTGEV